MYIMNSLIKSIIFPFAVIIIIIPSMVFAERELPVSNSNLLPHSSFYSLSMGTSKNSESFVDVKGIVRANLERTCEGWITSERIKMQVSLQSNRQWKQELIYTGWESNDGTKYRFATRSSNNGKTVKYRGIANSNENLPGKAIYSQPKKVVMILPPGTHFYYGLTAWLIKKARSGVRRAETTVFDGTDLDGPQQVTSFIIPIKAKDVLDKKMNSILGPLIERPGWKMHIAFYASGGRKAEPEYEVRAIILDNGIIPKLDLVFDTFTAVQTLEKIELIKAPNC